MEFPYLLLGSLKDWQACTGNPAQEEGGFPCLQETARYPAVASLAEKYVINVFIGGAQSAMVGSWMGCVCVCHALSHLFTRSKRSN